MGGQNCDENALTRMKSQDYYLLDLLSRGV